MSGKIYIVNCCSKLKHSVKTVDGQLTHFHRITGHRRIIGLLIDAVEIRRGGTNYIGTGVWDNSIKLL